MKKIGIITVSIVGILVITYFGYNEYLRNQYKDYLTEKYPEKEFQIHGITHDFLYKRIVAGVECMNDGTTFTITRGYKSNEMRDEYLRRMHDQQWDKILNEFFQGEEVLNYIRSINAAVDNSYETFNTDAKILYDQLPQRIFLSLYEEKIKNNDHRGEIMYDIVQILKKNKVNVTFINTDFDTKEGIFRLSLHKEDLDKSPEEIASLVERIK